MIESLQPPTDNLYKFLAVGGLAFALLALVFLFREQAKLREQHTSAQVELAAAGYVEGSGPPNDPELRRAFYRRQFAVQENAGLLKLAGGAVGSTVGISLTISLAAFVAWWLRVQRHDDAILRLTAAKLQREELAATTAPTVTEA